MTKLEPVVRWVAAILITGAAVSELTRQPTVMTGLETLGYPPTSSGSASERCCTSAWSAVSRAPRMTRPRTAR